MTVANAAGAVVCSGGAGAAGGSAGPDPAHDGGAAEAARHQVCALHRRAVPRAHHARRPACPRGSLHRHAQDGRSDRRQHVLTHRPEGVRVLWSCAVYISRFEISILPSGRLTSMFYFVKQLTT